MLTTGAVMIPLMPKGVEHLSSLERTLTSGSDDSIDAERR